MGTGGQGYVRPYESQISLVFRGLDAAIITATLWCALYFYGHSWSADYRAAASAGALLFLLVAEHRNLYRSWRGSGFAEEARNLWVAWAWTAAVLFVAAFATKVSAHYSRVVIFAWMSAVPLVLSLWRMSLRHALSLARAQGHNRRTAVIVGAGPLAARFAAQLREMPWMGIHVVGIIDDACEADAAGVRCLGPVAQVAEIVRVRGIDHVYIALPMQAAPQVERIVAQLADTTASVFLVPDVYTFNLLQAQWKNIAGFPVISIYDTPFDSLGGWIKRAEDLVLGSLFLAIAAIPMALIAIGVRRSSPGPIIFRQRRYGLNGATVEVWKFRTMTVCEDGAVARQAARGDARVTKFGAFLRRTSLDELPQLINVLQGCMSIVGPRPHPIALNEEFRYTIAGYMLRHKVKPGITGWAQVNGWRGETNTLDKMDGRVKHDLQYINRWSLWLDLRIIARTVLLVFKDPKAY